MGVSLLAAKRSKDPNTQVGACIVNQDHIIISTGYNGFPKNCSDDVFPWERTGKDTKYAYVVHAELNAILNSGGQSLRGLLSTYPSSLAMSAPKPSFNPASGKSSISATSTQIPMPLWLPKPCSCSGCADASAEAPHGTNRPGLPGGQIESAPIGFRIRSYFSRKYNHAERKVILL